MLEPNVFVKSSFSVVNCVAARLLPGGGVEVARFDDMDGVSLRYTHDEWEAFLAGVRAGDFDLP